ncbi:MAG: tetratricopeptide repeat protein, partial [Pirellulaceae bacterium]|nr:tetratricopeptide repeat protein [Pirellulaceae bacterium]
MNIKRILLLVIVISLAIGNSPILVYAQPADASAEAKAETEKINQQLSQMESELGKFKDSSPEAAALMLQLAEQYYQHGRSLGLIRICQRFIQIHINHPQHQAMMLKLMDGQQVLSRNNDLIVSARQFLQRYAKSPKAAEMEIRLADALHQTPDREAAANAAETVWQRYGNNPIGKKYVQRAVYLFQLQGGVTLQTHAAELSEAAFNKIPNGTFAQQMAENAIYLYARLSLRVESNRVIAKLFQRKLSGDAERQRQWHVTTALNYEQLQQYTNAAVAYQRAGQLRADAETLYGQTINVYRSATNPAQTESLVQQFKRLYPNDQRKWLLQQYAANQYQNAMNNAKALQLMREALVGDAITHNAAGVFIGLNGTELPRLQDTERVFRAAIGKTQNVTTRARLYRYLAFNIYTGEAFNKSRALQLCREFLSRYPENSSDTHAMIDYLFKNSEDDNRFRNDVKMVLTGRKKFLHFASFVSYPAAWVNANRSNKDFKVRAQILKQALAAADNDPLLKLWAQRGGNNTKGATIRTQLLAAPYFAAMNEFMAREILTMQTSYYRSYAPTAKRPEGVKYFAQWAQKFSKDEAIAVQYVSMAMDYGIPEECKLALQHMLRFNPTQNNADLYRRMLICAGRNEDLNLAKQTYAWIKREEQQHGVSLTYLANMGDVLTTLKLLDLAKERFQTGAKSAVLSADGRECVRRLVAIEMERAKKLQLLQQAYAKPSDQFGSLCMDITAIHLVPEEDKTVDWNVVLTLIEKCQLRTLESPFRATGFDANTVVGYLSAVRNDESLDVAQRQKVLQRFVKLNQTTVSAVAQLLLLNDPEVTQPDIMPSLLLFQRATYQSGEDYRGFDQLTQFAKAAAANQRHVVAAVLGTGILANFSSVDENRRKAVRDLVSRSYTQIGEVGLTIDEDSPIAPLLQAALYLRLGDQELAFEMYSENILLFDEHRALMPVDLVEFVVTRLIAAGGDENFNYVEDLVRTWIVKNSESAEVGIDAKATMQLLLARNYFKARRFDIARSEFTTVVNRYPDTSQSVDAQFGIGESFMEQRVFDQAQLVFDKLSNNTETLIVVRAEFLRGVLSFRRGDRDEARDIFRSVLERVPDVELANQTLFNLAEIYRVEERYMDQLNLLRTIGRLGRNSKNRHTPGSPLSIVVHDSDLGISRGHNRIPVLVSTSGGDQELVYLISSGAGKGLFRGDLDTQLGEPTPGDGTLHLVGTDIIKCDYPEEFRKEFKSVPLSDVDIRIAANAKFEIASSIDADQEDVSFSETLIQEQIGQQDQQLSQSRSVNQVKPGNPLYIHVEDPDQDRSQELDNLVVKLVTDSGDEVQVELLETGPHTGIFEGSLKTAELPAGALATDSAIDHSPLMAIDNSMDTFWLSQPDGATPKDLTVDMKDLYEISRVNIATPDAESNRPLRLDVLGSYDGEFWFRMSSFPRRIEVQKPQSETQQIISGVQQTVIMGNHQSYRNWNQVNALINNDSLIWTETQGSLLYQEEIPEGESAVARSVVWSGLFNMESSGAVRFRIRGNTTGLVVNGILEMPLDGGIQTVDVWLEKGTHELQAFSAFGNQAQGGALEHAIASVDSQQVFVQPMRSEQFVAAPPQVAVEVLTAPKVTSRVNVDVAELQKMTETFAVEEKGEFKVTKNWSAVEDGLTLQLANTAPGMYELWLDYSNAGGVNSVAITLDQQTVEHSLVNTGSWDTYQSVFAGHVLLEATGKNTLQFNPINAAANLMELKGVELRPISRDAIVQHGNVWEFRFPKYEVRYTKVVIHEYSGDSVAVNQIEIGNAQANTVQIPTEDDLLALANNEILEIAAGDHVVATYTDENTQNEHDTSQLLTRELTATYNNAEINAIAYNLTRARGGGVSTERKELMRVDPGERIVIEVVDYDEDRSNEVDTISVEVTVNGSEPLVLEATETDNNTGVFTREIDTAAEATEGALVVAVGDIVELKYLDRQNTFPGHTVPRVRRVFVNKPTDAVVRIIPSLAHRIEGNVLPRAEYLTVQTSGISESDPASGDNAIDTPAEAVDPAESSQLDAAAVAFAVPLLVEVFDPDRAKDSGSVVNVVLVTTGGSAVVVECVISNAHSDLPRSATDNEALLAGRFVGQVIMQLGSKDSPSVIPLTAEMPRGLIGRVHDGKEEQELLPGLVAMVLNVTGTDTINLRYKDEITPAAEETIRSHTARLVVTGELTVTDREYEESVEQLHVGEKIFLRVFDADQDVSDKRDSVEITLTTKIGEKETVTLVETTVHSGDFTGAFTLAANENPVADNLNADDPIIETNFGDVISVTYNDKRSADSVDPLALTTEIPVVVGTNGLVAAFSKAFNDEELAVETKFRIAESYFELFKSHKEIGRDEEQLVDLESGRRILQEVMEDYPDPKYVPRISYLLGQFSQELGQWSQAITSYEVILHQYADHTLAPDAQFKMAQCYEESGDFNEALEAYVTLAATFPKSPLIASVMIRISDHFYKAENYVIAAQVGEKFLEKFEAHEHAQRMAFRVGQAYYKNEEFTRAAESFDQFSKLFPDDTLGADGLFWSGESYRMANNDQLAFRRYNRCRWDFPA